MNGLPRKQAKLSDAGPPLSPLPPPSRELTGGGRLLFPGILLVYLVFAILHSAVTPTGQTGYQNAPDEAAHVRYIETLLHGKLPTQTSAAGDPIGYEWHQPPLYYWLARPFFAGGEHAARYFSILCGLGCIYFVYRAGRLIFPDDPCVANLAAALCAWTPTHIAIASTVNNDSLLELCFSAALLALFAAFHAGFTGMRAVWLGLAIGCAILTKATGILLFPVAFVAMLFLWRTGEPIANLLRGLATTLIVAFAVCGWWFVRNVMLYGQPLPINAFQASFGGTAQAADLVRVLGWSGYYQLVGTWTFQSLWAVYGGKQDLAIGRPRYLPPQAYQVMALLTAGAFLGLIRAHWRRKLDFTATQRNAILVSFITVGLVLVSFLGFIHKYFQAQGRYFYPAWLPICLLFALGWKSLVPARYFALTSSLIAGLMALLSVAYLLTIRGHA